MDMAAKTRMDPALVQSLQSEDVRHHLHPFTDPKAIQQAAPFMIERSEGIYIEGQGFRLLDAMAGLGCVNIGYGRRDMAAVAAEVMTALPFYHCFAAVTHPYAARLAKKIAGLVPQEKARVFFANSGSEANETIIKLARLYWKLKGHSKKTKIVTRDYAYHGSTELTSALTGNSKMQEPFGLDHHPDIIRAMAPYWYRYGGDMMPEAFGLHAAEDIATKIDAVGAGSVAAVIVEPIMGTSGAIIPPDSYFPRLAEICRERDVLMIADEVVTGFGRTGHWFAQEALGFKADFTALAKGLSSAYQPISAAVVAGHIAEILDEGTGVLQHGFTTTAHPVAAAVALKNIEIIEQEGLVQRISRDIGPRFATALKTLETLPLVGEIRVRGLIAGIELVKTKATREQYPAEAFICEAVSQACLVRGVIIRPVGNALVLCPPFIISRAEVDEIVRVLREALIEVQTKIESS